MIIWLRDWFLLRGVITGRQPTGSYRWYADVFRRALRSLGLWLEPKEETCSIRKFINCCWALLTNVDRLRYRTRWWWFRDCKNFKMVFEGGISTGGHTYLLDTVELYVADQLWIPMLEPLYSWKLIMHPTPLSGHQAFVPTQLSSAWYHPVFALKWSRIRIIFISLPDISMIAEPPPPPGGGGRLIRN